MAHADGPGLHIGERALFCALPFAVLALVVWGLTHLPLPLAARWDWVPALGISLAFRIDGLSALMLLMISGVGSAVFVYAGGYMHGHPGQRRLYVLLTLFMLTMIVCVSADDLFVLFMGWEITSVLSFMLVGFEHERGSARRAAQQAMLVTGSGGLAMLAGFVVLAQALDTSTISTIVERLPATAPTPALTAAMLLILVGAFTKSAQWPFHFWLPNAMSAPTPVSAYLHSATMVKLGVYLLGRFERIGISNGLVCEKPGKPDSALGGQPMPAWMAWNWRLGRCLVWIRPALTARLALVGP